MQIIASWIIFIQAAPLSPEFQLKEVYPELLDAVADRISYEFIEVGLELGLRLDEILRFRMKHNDPLQTNREMLREWHRRNKREGKATIAWLTHCLLNTRSDIGTLIELEEKAFQEKRAAKEGKSGCSISWLDFKYFTVTRVSIYNFSVYFYQNNVLDFQFCAQMFWSMYFLYRLRRMMAHEDHPVW